MFEDVVGVVLLCGDSLGPLVANDLSNFRLNTTLPAVDPAGTTVDDPADGGAAASKTSFYL